MGIESFGSFIKTQFRKSEVKTIDREVSSLFIDCNGIFHTSSQEVYKTKRDRGGNYVYPESERLALKRLDKDILEKRLVKKIIDTFEELIMKFKPKDNLVLAPDGVAPAAKMSQQKFRRYGNPSNEDSVFNNHVFTPGTEIMIKLDKAIKNWLEKKRNILPEKIIYSGHDVVGEGEHKIFDYIRRRVITYTRGAHIVYGADSDLFILSLVSPLNNIYLYREDKTLLYDINKLKKLILERFSIPDVEDKVIFQDFALLSFFVGNDFLPKMPNLPNTMETMKLVNKVYRIVKKPLSDIEGNIIWSNFYHLFNCLDKFKFNDYGLYENNFLRPFKFPYQILRENINLKDVNGNIVDEIYDSSKHVINFDLERFAHMWYNKQFKPEKRDLISLYPEKYFTTNDIVKMVVKYLQGFQWILKYYLYGFKNVSNMYYYPFKYTPLSLSVINYLKLLIDKNKLNILDKINNNIQENFTPLHQLLLVLPPSSLNLIPFEYHEIYKTRLACISPVSYPEPKPEGTDNDWTAKPKIPNINPRLVLEALKGIKIPSYMQNHKDIIIYNRQKRFPNDIIRKDIYKVSKQDIMET
jgi:5'-3' exonuclease